VAVSAIVLALAAQAAGQEIKTFHPLPSQRPQQAEQQQQDAKTSGGPAPQEAKAEEKPREPEKIEILSVREVPPGTRVKFVPPPEDKPE